MWRLHFQPLLFSDIRLTAVHYDQLPVFTYREEPTSEVVLRLMGVVAVMAVLGAACLAAGLRAYRRYSLVH